MGMRRKYLPQDIVHDQADDAAIAEGIGQIADVLGKSEPRADQCAHEEAVPRPAQMPPAENIHEDDEQPLGQLLRKWSHHH